MADRAAAHSPLDDPYGVTFLLNSIREAGAHQQAAALADRAAAHVPLDDPAAVASLLDSLRESGAHQQAAALAGRLSAAGMFGLFLEQNSSADQFRFGRQAGGTRPHHGDGKTWTYGLSRPRGHCTGAGLSGMPMWAGLRHGSPPTAVSTESEEMN